MSAPAAQSDAAPFGEPNPLSVPMSGALAKASDGVYAPAVALGVGGGSTGGVTLSTAGAVPTIVKSPLDVPVASSEPPPPYPSTFIFPFVVEKPGTIHPYEVFKILSPIAVQTAP